MYGLCVYVYMHVCTHVDMYIDLRRQLEGCYSGTTHFFFKNVAGYLTA